MFVRNTHTHTHPHTHPHPPPAPPHTHPPTHTPHIHIHTPHPHTHPLPHTSHTPTHRHTHTKQTNKNNNENKKHNKTRDFCFVIFNVTHLICRLSSSLIKEFQSCLKLNSLFVFPVYLLFKLISFRCRGYCTKNAPLKLARSNIT